jgi:hypothetical protein
MTMFYIAALLIDVGAFVVIVSFHAALNVLSKPEAMLATMCLASARSSV